VGPPNELPLLPSGDGGELLDEQAMPAIDSMATTEKTLRAGVMAAFWRVTTDGRARGSNLNSSADNGNRRASFVTGRLFVRSWFGKKI
jgi:hypothetical protein